MHTLVIYNGLNGFEISKSQTSEILKWDDELVKKQLDNWQKVIDGPLYTVEAGEGADGGVISAAETFNQLDYFLREFGHDVAIRHSKEIETIIADVELLKNIKIIIFTGHHSSGGNFLCGVSCDQLCKLVNAAESADKVVMYACDSAELLTKWDYSAITRDVELLACNSLTFTYHEGKNPNKKVREWNVEDKVLTEMQNSYSEAYVDNKRIKCRWVICTRALNTFEKNKNFLFDMLVIALNNCPDYWKYNSKWQEKVAKTITVPEKHELETQFITNFFADNSLVFNKGKKETPQDNMCKKLIDLVNTITGLHLELAKANDEKAKNKKVSQQGLKAINQDNPSLQIVTSSVIAMSADKETIICPIISEPISKSEKTFLAGMATKAIIKKYMNFYKEFSALEASLKIFDEKFILDIGRFFLTLIRAHIVAAKGCTNWFIWADHNIMSKDDDWYNKASWQSLKLKGGDKQPVAYELETWRDKTDVGFIKTEGKLKAHLGKMLKAKPNQWAEWKFTDEKLG